MKKIYIFAVITLLILQKAFPQAIFDIEGNSCKNSTIQFIDKSVITVTDWHWDFGDGEFSTEQNPIHAYAETGTYTVNLTITSNGIDYESNPETIKISDLPIVNFMVDSTQVYYSTYSRVFIDSSVSFNPVSLYVWDFGDETLPDSTTALSFLHKFSDRGTYNVWLKVIDNQGCVDSTMETVTINDRFYIPNVFTPNGDPYNNEFIVTSNGETLFSIEIYSRWGNLVFKREGQQQIVWDGRLPDGTLIQPGTYYYVINSETGNITYNPEKGFITVFY